MRPFTQVDVFTNTPYRGNPLAVVLDSDGLSTAEMQQFANWTNLSETTFVLPPTDPAADYRVRIFTTDVELPFAGHPTIGTCHAWLEAGGTPKRDGVVVQECAAGLITLRNADRLAFAAPPLDRTGPVDDADLDDICAVLGIDRGMIVDAAWADNGPGWIAVQLADADAVLALEPNLTARPTYQIGVVGMHADDQEAAIEVRALFKMGDGPGAEDPVTGSLNAALAQWLLAKGALHSPYMAVQGTAIGRDGRVFVEEADGEIWIGGDAVTCIAGHAEL
ncbi:MAG: PhzF family phenazine biosynthesis protein [Acidimicrobiales bacterium]|nr:PhzF family phenazine biosynthesis protein [Acidimicrobiales bacterium]